MVFENNEQLFLTLLGCIPGLMYEMSVKTYDEAQGQSYCASSLVHTPCTMLKSMKQGSSKRLNVQGVVLVKRNDLYPWLLLLSTIVGKLWIGK